MTSTRTPQLAGPTAGDEKLRTPRRAGFSQKLGRWDVKLSPYLYISPFFLLFIVVGLFPLFYTAFVSVHQWGLLKGQGDYVGLENFTTVLAAADLLEVRPQHPQHLPAELDPADRHGPGDRRDPRREPARQDVLAHGRAGPLRGRTGRRRPDLRPDVRRPVGHHQPDPARPRHPRGPLARRGPPQPHRDRDDGELPLDRLQHPHPPGGDAGDPAGRLRGRAHRRREPRPSVLLGHHPDAAPRDHLRDHHVDHRRPADLRRAAHVRPGRPRRLRPAVPHGDQLHLPAGLGAEELRSRRRGRLVAVRASSSSSASSTT